ncbi:MAG: hypothetical protein EBU70_11260, partial [Actinobacteria bacterium]|nr:hypothetical protein [Actinomycetota bacterium]
MSQIDRRLKNVQQADLSESRLNDDFVHWLRTWGSNILLVVMVVAALVMLWFRWQQGKIDERDEAWKRLGGLTVPESIEEFAAQHPGKDAIGAFAEMQLADRYLSSVASGRRFDRDASAVDSAMTPELRTEWLRKADALYAGVATRIGDAKAPGDLGFVLGSLFGRAAVAEDLGDLKAAEEHLREASRRAAGTDFASIGEVADKRIATLQSLAAPVEFPSRPAPAAAAPPTAIPDLTGAPTPV